MRNEWLDIETAPDDRPIQAWHRVWKCPVTIQRRSFGDRSAWVEKTLTTEWPLEAFSHWMEPTAPPVGPDAAESSRFFADIERTIIDYFDRHDAKIEERGAEWFLVDEEENKVSLTGLAAAVLRTTG